MVPKTSSQLELFKQWELDGEKYIRTEIWFQFNECVVSCDGKKHWTNSWVSGRLLTSGEECNCKGESNGRQIENKEGDQSKDSSREESKENPS